MYLLVKQNPEGVWEIQKVISSPINVRSTISDTIYGDISRLDLATRILEGFWEQEDVYNGTGEYKVFESKEVEFDAERALVINTYNYVLMPIQDIRDDFKSRMKSLRNDEIVNGGVLGGNDAHVFPSNDAARSMYSLIVAARVLDAESFKEPVIIEDVHGNAIELSSVEFDKLVVDLALQTHQLYAKCRDIIAQIDEADSLESIRAVAVW